MGHHHLIGGIIVAAGRGTRMGGVDKCALHLCGRSILSYSVEKCADVVDALVVVVSGETIDRWKETAKTESWPSETVIVAGGASRQESVYAGFMAVEASLGADVIAIHDGARPLVSAALLMACIARGAEAGAAIAATPLTDTVKRGRNGYVVETIDRAALWAAQTPQVFRKDVLNRAYAWAAEHGSPPFTDEAGLIEAYGHPVAIVPGERSNIKVTEPGDHRMAELLMDARNGSYND